jgi:prepilin-type N-terminal cleavage/methylation domain-containing protein
MVFAKLVSRGAKSGYTLVEVLVVVSIIGILSAMGVAGLQRAVANARIKDSAINTAAFIERVANLSTQRNEVLCLRVDPHNDQTLIVVRDNDTNCQNPNDGIIASYSIESPCRFVDFTTCGAIEVDWFSSKTNYSEKTAFRPRIGLAATPPHGGICIQHGTDDIYGAVAKEKTLNRVKPMWKVGSASGGSGWSGWTEL